MIKDFFTLKKGDHIRILCTARSATSSALQPAKQLLESWGYRVSYGATIDKVHHQFGGDKSLRLRDLQQALYDDDINAIWIARGGYGSIQIVDDLAFKEHCDKEVHTERSRSAKAESQQKLLIGYSDVTLLHAAWQQHGIPSLHSFMPLELKDKPIQAIDSLKKALCGEQQEIIIPYKNGLKNQEIYAPVVGGNLSILYSLLGSETFPATKDCFLFIEDIDEYLYHIERMMYGLKRAGHLDHIKGLIVGGMSAMRDHEIPFGKNAYEIITDLTSDYDFPVIFDFPAGHVDDHRSIKLGTMVNLKIENDIITFIL